MKIKQTILILLLLSTLAVYVTACSVNDESLNMPKDFYSKVINRTIPLVEDPTIDDADIRLYKTYFGSFSAPEKKEFFALCKFNNPVHVAGLDRTIGVIFSCETFEVVAYKEFAADEVTLHCLPTESGDFRVLFFGKSTNQGISAETVQLFGIHESEWIELPIDGIEMQKDEWCYLISEDCIVVMEKNSEDVPEKMVSLLKWNPQTERFEANH